MKTFRLFLILSAFMSMPGHAQNKDTLDKPLFVIIDDDPTPALYPWLGKSDSRSLTEMKVVYTKPEGFRENSIVETFEGNRRLETIFSHLLNQLESDDHQFVAFLPIVGSAREDSIELRRDFPDMELAPVNMWHINQIKGLIRKHSGAAAANRWKERMNYYSQEEARNIFNADTAMRFVLPLETNTYYKGIYPYSEMLFIQKNGTGYVTFYCFYTDKAKENLDFYWKKIEGVLRFEE